MGSHHRAHLGEAAQDAGIVRTVTMCPPQDIPPLRERFGAQLAFNGPVHKDADQPNDVAYRLLDGFLAQTGLTLEPRPP